MQIQSVSFQNYKAFSTEQKIEIKPITILIGKNSSGKSAIAKLFTLFENSLTSAIDEPLHISNNGVKLGGEFRDIVYNNDPKGPVYFSISFNNGQTLKVGIIKEDDINPTLRIYSWQYKDYDLTYSNPDKLYINKDGTKFSIEFMGFIPNWQFGDFVTLR